MGLVSRVIKSLINGVSQQSPSARLDNQVEAQVNMIPDIAGILTRRSPVKLDDIETQDGSRVYADEHAMFTMTIQGEKVSCGIKPDGTLYRFDEDNANTTSIIQLASSKTYLTHTDKDDISTVETSDSLVILNRGITVALETAPTASTNVNTRALLWVTQAQSGATYKVWHTDVSTSTKRLIAEHVAIAADTPQYIMQKLVSGASTGNDMYKYLDSLGAGYIATIESTFHTEKNTCIVRGKDMDFLEVECDYGDYIFTTKEADFGNTKVLKDTSNLPAKIDTNVLDVLTPSNTTNYANFIIRVNPLIGETLTNYYLRYSEDFDAWVEVSDDYVTTIDNTTMPITIVKDTVTTLDIAHSVFTAPLAGDNLSNPPPTIVGSKIKDIIIYNSRLGFAGESTLVFSVIDDYYNLYRTATSSVLTKDVVDLELDSSKLGYSVIDNIFTMDNDIVINTGLSQSILVMPTNLDISKAIFASISSFDLGNNIPIPVRRSMYFPIKQGSFSIIKSFQKDKSNG
ncbi:hypothetical protein KAU11_08150, partial [Candidatus Babeliales bacterium]|nr:hypothetical protein [Candidatus Babeliales bacterium]